MPSQNIPALTGLRFFAAMAIVVWHTQTGYFFKYGAFDPFNLAGAVQLFFVLSGFVLTLGADRYRSKADFFVARVARIWPAHIAALAFFLMVMYPGGLGSVPRLVLNVLLLQAWSPDRAVFWSYNAPSWSVSCELFFYAMFPVIYLCLQRQTLTRVVLAVAALFCTIVLAGKIYPATDIVWLAEDNPLAGLASFAIGVAVGIWHKRAPPSAGGYGGSSSVIQVSVLILAIGANAYLAWHVARIDPAPATFIVFSGPAPIYAAMLLVLARYDGWLSRALSHRVIVYGGEISYAIYLFHQIIIRWHAGHLMAFASIPVWLQYAGMIIATLLIAASIHHLIERPARRWIVAGWAASWGPGSPIRAQVTTESGDTYSVPVEVEGGAVTQVHWRNGGNMNVEGGDLEAGEAMGTNSRGEPAAPTAPTSTSSRPGAARAAWTACRRRLRR